MNDHDFVTAEKHLEELTSYKFIKRELLREALYPLNEVACIEGQLHRLLAQGNKMMAIVGDTVMRTAVMDAFYPHARGLSCSKTQEHHHTRMAVTDFV